MDQGDKQAKAPPTGWRSEILTQAPAALIGLMWEEFFSSRQRGVSLALNLPWLNDGLGFFVCGLIDGQVVGGLAVRPARAVDGSGQAGVIGLVCVDPAHRGRGHAARLLQAAIRQAQRLGFDDLILWTGKPGVYRAAGFVSDDTALFGSVVGPAQRAIVAHASAQPWPCGAERRGLPAFARQAWRYVGDDAAIIVLDDGQDLIVAEWQGSDAAVLALIAQTMPSRWRLNALAQDSLPAALAAAHWTVALQPANLQMHLALRHGSNAAAQRYALRILDRV